MAEMQYSGLVRKYLGQKDLCNRVGRFNILIKIEMQADI